MRWGYARAWSTVATLLVLRPAAFEFAARRAYICQSSGLPRRSGAIPRRGARHRGTEHRRAVRCCRRPAARPAETGNLSALLEATRRIAVQTRQRITGTMPDGAHRRVSLHDGDTQPIAKGRLGRPVEFGYKS